MSLRKMILGGVLWSLLLPIASTAQQTADTAFIPPLERPEFNPGQGPVVAIDEAHHNFHTADGRYLAFATLLRRDGYRVRAMRDSFTGTALQGIDVLVIANALHERNLEEWTLPTPSAFTTEEIDALVAWVRSGGSLLLIADHMPMPGAAYDLGQAFGFRMMNGFVFESDEGGPIVFRRSDESLQSTPITDGRSVAERVDSVVSYTGQAIQLEPGGTPLLVLRPGSFSLNPEEAWEFDDTTPREEVGGWSQGGVRQFGAGRVAVFGEAAMFTAQVAGVERRKMGMNRPEAAQNAQFLLNVLHWLTGRLSER